jgi:hypothetical protein
VAVTTLEDIAQAIETNDTVVLDDVVDELCGSVEDHTLDELEAACELLSDARQFTALGRLADASIQQGRHGTMWQHLVQSLLDNGAYTAAKATITTTLERNDLTSSQRSALAGQLGRIGKDLYFRTAAPEHLVASVQGYSQAVRSGGDPLWHGVNAHALAHLARKRGIEVSPPDIESTHDLMRRAEANAASDPTNKWAIATMIETSLLIGNPIPIDTIATQLADASPFLHASLRRQLREVWGLPDDHPAIMTLAEFSLSHGGTDEIALPPTPDGYEKMFGTEAPIPLENYRSGSKAAESVCTLTTAGGFHAGTGFALDGAHLHPSLVGRRVIITNEHVVPLPTREGVRAETINASFTARNIEPLGGFTCIWWSAREDLDIAVLVSDQLDGSDVASLQPASSVPEVVDGAYVYVVGHPGGGGLQMSIRGNDLLDTDGIRLHYRAPTKGGSSGSPVFDRAWQLVGVHHYGSSNLSALKHKTGRYAGNQGTALGAVIERLTNAGIDQKAGTA